MGFSFGILHSYRVLSVQGMYINDRLIVFIFCIPYEWVLIWTTTILWLTTTIMHQETICKTCMFTYWTQMPPLYMSLPPLRRVVENVLPEMYVHHNIQRPVPIFVHGRDPLSSWQKFWSSLIMFDPDSKMEQGTTLSFLASHRPFSNLSLKRARETSPGRHYS